MSTDHLSRQFFALVVLVALLGVLAPVRTFAVGSLYLNAPFAVPTKGTITRQLTYTNVSSG